MPLRVRDGLIQAPPNWSSPASGATGERSWAFPSSGGLAWSAICRSDWAVGPGKEFFVPEKVRFEAGGDERERGIERQTIYEECTLNKLLPATAFDRLSRSLRESGGRGLGRCDVRCAIHTCQLLSELSTVLLFSARRQSDSS